MNVCIINLSVRLVTKWIYWHQCQGCRNAKEASVELLLKVQICHNEKEWNDDLMIHFSVGSHNNPNYVPRVYQTAREMICGIMLGIMTKIPSVFILC